jgi:hypothetical protein
MDQELPLYGQKWLAPPESRVCPSEVGQVQFPMTRLPQKTLVGPVFTLAVVGVASMYPMVGQEDFMTDRAPNPALCEKINDTRTFYSFKNSTHYKKSLRNKTSNHLTSWKNSYNNQH